MSTLPPEVSVILRQLRIRKSPATKWEPPGFGGVNTAIGAAAALMTAVGVSSGVATRMLRNEWPLVVGLIVVMVGATIYTMKSKTLNQWAVSFAGFFVGVVGLTALAGTTSQAKERPQIFTSSETMPSGLVKITTTVKAEGLRMKDLIYVVSKGSLRVRLNPVTGEVIGTEPGQTRAVIEEAAFGPNAAGSVEAALIVEVSPALFRDVVTMASRQPGIVKNEDAECIPVSPRGEPTTAQGCARFILPFAPIRPVVTASITAGSETTPTTLTAQLSAGGVSPSRVINIKAWVGSGPPLIDQAVGPDLAGNVRATITVPMKSVPSEVCVVAALIKSTTQPSRPPVTQALCDPSNDVPQTVGVAVVRMK